jgi:hypothetical protein
MKVGLAYVAYVHGYLCTYCTEYNDVEQISQITEQQEYDATSLSSSILSLYHSLYLSTFFLCPEINDAKLCLSLHY